MPQDFTLDLQLTFEPKQLPSRFTQHLVQYIRGNGPYIFDEKDVRYFDCINTFSHVGHCNLGVYEAVFAQMIISPLGLQSPDVVTKQFTRKFQQYLPAELCTFFFTDSKSEAMDLAITLAQTYTRHSDCVVVDGSRHGSYSLGAYVSADYTSKEYTEKQKWVHILPLPDTYRGIYRDISATDRYVTDAINVISKAVANNRKIAAFITEPVFTFQGAIVPPQGWFKAVAKHIRDAGGVVIVDESYTGLGRVVSKFWGYEILPNEGVIPDIIVVGENIGNGYPMGIVITTAQIAKRFPANRYPSKYSGNEVASAAGLAVLEEFRDKEMLISALRRSTFAFDKLLSMKRDYANVGNVRGCGLNIAMEIVTDKKSRNPDSLLAHKILFRLRDLNILVGLHGKDDNVILMMLPMCLNLEENQLIDSIESVLRSNLREYHIPFVLPTPILVQHEEEEEEEGPLRQPQLRGDEEPGPSERSTPSPKFD